MNILFKTLENLSWVMYGYFIATKNWLAVLLCGLFALLFGIGQSLFEYYSKESKES